MIIKFYRAIFRGTSSQGFVRFQVQKVNGFSVVSVNWFTQPACRRIWVVIVEHILNRVPTSCKEDILLYVFFLTRLVDPAPVNKGGHELLLFVFVLYYFLERLHSSSVLDVEAIDTASLVSDEQLAASVIHAHASDVFRCSVTEHTLESTINGIPDFNAARMSSNESVEYRVVKYTAASLVISEMVVSRLIIVVKFHASASSNDSLGRLGDCETVHFVKRAVKGLDGGESTDIPDTEHA